MDKPQTFKRKLVSAVAIVFGLFTAWLIVNATVMKLEVDEAAKQQELSEALQQELLDNLLRIDGQETAPENTERLVYLEGPATISKEGAKKPSIDSLLGVELSVGAPYRRNTWIYRNGKWDVTEVRLLAGPVESEYSLYVHGVLVDKFTTESYGSRPNVFLAFDENTASPKLRLLQQHRLPARFANRHREVDETEPNSNVLIKKNPGQLSEGDISVSYHPMHLGIFRGLGTIRNGEFVPKRVNHAYYQKPITIFKYLDELEDPVNVIRRQFPVQVVKKKEDLGWGLAALILLSFGVTVIAGLRAMLPRFWTNDDIEVAESKLPL